MIRIASVLVVAAALTVACGAPASAPAKLSAPPGPVMKYQHTLSGQTAGVPIDLVQTVFGFSPGAASLVHTHIAPSLATVLQGQITVKMPSGDKQASTGEALVEPVNQPVQAVNTGAETAIVAGAFPVPHGKKPTAPVAGRPAPATPNATLYTFTVDSPNIQGAYALIQQVLDFGAGSSTLKYRLGGPGVMTVIQGELTLNTDGTEKTYYAGESFPVSAGPTLRAFNPGGADSVIVASYLLPDGSQLTTNR